jgi:hypothetical protein
MYRASPARLAPTHSPRFRSEAYNNDKDKAPVVSKRKKRSQQETLEASSFTVLAAMKEKAAEEKERKEWEMEHLSLPLLHPCLSK